MERSLGVAVAKVPICDDPRVNGEVIRRQMNCARARGADLVLFPEGALSGYVKREISAWVDVDWDLLTRETFAISQLAKELGLWVVFGTAFHEEQKERPFNSLMVVSDNGELVGRYDKRILSFSEQNDWFVAGSDNKIFEINGLRVGFALCIEIRFPELLAELDASNVDLVLVSSYSRDPQDELLACANAGFYNLFLAFSAPANVLHREISSLGVGPDGKVLVRCKTASQSPAIFHVKPDEPHWEFPLRRAKPWRRQIRSVHFQQSRQEQVQ